MQRRDDLYLADILEAAESIRSFVAKLNRLDRDALLGDDLVRSAVLQKLSAIGEAAARVSEETTALHPEIWWHQAGACGISSSMPTSRWTGTSSGMRRLTPFPGSQPRWRGFWNRASHVPRAPLWERRSSLTAMGPRDKAQPALPATIGG
jgi:hypothetical protein